MMMSILPAIPVLLLVIVAIWFFWPLVFDPFARMLSRRGLSEERDQVAEHLFEAWNELRPERG